VGARVNLINFFSQSAAAPLLIPTAWRGIIDVALQRQCVRALPTRPCCNHTLCERVPAHSHHTHTLSLRSQRHTGSRRRQAGRHAACGANSPSNLLTSLPNELMQKYTPRAHLAFALSRSLAFLSAPPTPPLLLLLRSLSRQRLCLLKNLC
jgi:hypothetical protein